MNRTVNSKHASPEELIVSLHEQFGLELLSFCRSRLGFHDGQEVYQTVWLKAMKHQDRFDGSNPRAWLYAIARNTIYDTAKKKKPKLDSDFIEAGVEHSASDALEDLIEIERASQFTSCLDRLEPLKKKLLQLRMLGESYKSIANSLKISSGTVGSRFSRVKEELKDCVEGKHD